MISVQDLIEELQKFPPDALARGFEGIVDGVIVVASRKNAYGGRDQLGCITAGKKMVRLRRKEIS